MKKETMERLNKIHESIKPKQSVYQEDTDALDLYLYGDIEQRYWKDEAVIDAQSVQEALNSNPNAKDINVYINSCGGDVFEGVAIYNQLKRANANIHVFVDGSACSIASIIAMAGDTVTMYPTSMMLVHNCWTYTRGNAKELRKAADDLDKAMEANRQAYLDKAGDKLSQDKLLELLDSETWLTAQDCLDLGLCDEIKTEEKPSNPDNDGVNQKVDDYQVFKNCMERYKEETKIEEKEDQLEETGWFF